MRTGKNDLMVPRWAEAPGEYLLRAITDHAVYFLDSKGVVLTWNPGAERIKGYKADEIVGRNFSVFYTDEDRLKGTPAKSLDAARNDGFHRSEGWRLRRDGSWMWAGTALYAIYDEGIARGFAKITRDLTEQLQHRKTVAAMSENMALALAFLPCGACLIDRNGCIVLANPAFQTIFPATMIGFPLLDTIRVRDPAGSGNYVDFCAWPWVPLEPGLIGCDVAADDLILAARARASPGQGWVITFEDVTARWNAERDALHKADHDALTGLANLEGIDAHLKRGLKACAASGGCAVLLLDLDGFKDVNDTYGHQAGDTILREAAMRILKVTCPGDYTCRLGGDEFMVVPAWPISTEQAMKVADRLEEAFDKPFIVDARRIDIGVSIGLAVSLAGASDAAELTGRADLALYKAKHDGRGCIRLFDNELGLAILKRRAMEAQLAQALSAKEFTLAYQPICSAKDHEVHGFEALLRWRRADGSEIAPADFIPLAEELGLMTQIGGWVLDTACVAAADWPAHLTLSVNVSPTQLHDPMLVARIEGALRLARLPPQRLEIEITESAMIIDHALTLTLLKQLRMLGVGIAIDDFGTGYSSLTFLHTLPLTRVKIDRSFVRDIVDSPASMSIVRAVMQMGRDLGLAVTAEGVETEAQRTLLVAEFYCEMQGYLFAEPMPGEDLRQFFPVANVPAFAHSA